MTDLASRTKIGFIGLGCMRHRIAKNIVEKGYALTVLRRKKREAVDDLNGRWAKEVKSAKDVAPHLDVIFLRVTGSREVKAILRGDGRLKQRLKAGTVRSPQQCRSQKEIRGRELCPNLLIYQKAELR